MRQLPVNGDEVEQFSSRLREKIKAAGGPPGKLRRWVPIGAGAPVPSLYASATLRAAIHETIFHDIPAKARIKTVRLNEVHLRTHSELATNRDRRLVELRAVPLGKWGISRRDLISSSPALYGQTVLWAAAIHGDLPDAGVVEGGEAERDRLHRRRPRARFWRLEPRLVRQGYSVKVLVEQCHVKPPRTRASPTLSSMRAAPESRRSGDMPWGYRCEACPSFARPAAQSQQCEPVAHNPSPFAFIPSRSRSRISVSRNVSRKSR